MISPIKYILLTIFLIKVGVGFCQLSNVDTAFRNKDTIWINFTERFDVDTTFRTWDEKNPNKIETIRYRFISDRDLNFVLNKVRNEITTNSKSYSGSYDYEKAFLFNIFFTRAFMLIDETDIVVGVDGMNQKKIPIVQCRLKNIFDQMIKENIPLDTFNFSLVEYELTRVDCDEKGKTFTKQIPDSMIVSYNQDQYENDMAGYRLRDNYFELLDIFDKTNLPIGRTQELVLTISPTGFVESVSIKFINKENYVNIENVFQHLKYPILLVNGIVRPYKIRIYEDDYPSPFETALRNRFSRALQSGKNVYPIFNEQDSLFLYESVVDSMYFLYTTLHSRLEYPDYLVKFPDTNSVSSMFFDFNKDGLVDFVYPKTSPLFNETQDIVIYGGSIKAKNGLPEPQKYYDLKYSTDSSVFSSYEKQWDGGFRQTTLYTFRPNGDSVLLQCTTYEAPASLMAVMENNFASYSIPNYKGQWARVFHFVNNLDKSLSEHRYYVNKLYKAKKAYKKMRKMIFYYRDNPEKIPH